MEAATQAEEERSTGPLEGSFHKSLVDQLQSVFSAPVRILKAGLFFYVLCAALVIFVEYMDELAITTEFIINTAFVSLVAPILFMLILIFANLFYFLKLSKQHKSMSYRIGNAGVELFDGAGHATRIPWSELRRVRKSPQYFLLVIHGGCCLLYTSDAADE